MASAYFLGFLTIFLAVFCGSSVGLYNSGVWSQPDDQCQDVFNNYYVCEDYIVGGYSEPLPQCCSGLVYLNNAAKHGYGGARRICQCIENIAASSVHPPYSEHRINALYYKCNIHLSFPISERLDCSRVGY